MPFTFNIGVGMAAGFVLHPLVKALAGRAREVSAAGIAFAAASLLFFVSFPYR
jgi:xanthine/uracil/vitamin C permease (AzgA family)